MSLRARLAILGVICVVALGGGIVYFVKAKADVRQQQSSPPSVAQAPDPSAMLAGGHVLFRSSVLGSTYGKLGVVSLSDPSGPRGFFNSVCERVYATATDGVCVTADRGITPTYAVQMLDAHMQPTTSSELTGLPSRARISKDGLLVATTTFVTGHSYTGSSFSTATIIRRADGSEIGNLENFAATVDGNLLTAVDRNYWGVSFADDDHFYATAASTKIGKTWLMRGSLSAKTMNSVRTDAECPSLSPDGTKLAYKVRQGNPAPGQWQLAVLDVATNKQTVLAETRSVDDQVEWLDSGHILYGLPRSGTEATISDVWQVPADGTGKPSVFISQASSPAVVRS